MCGIGGGVGQVRCWQNRCTVDQGWCAVGGRQGCGSEVRVRDVSRWGGVKQRRRPFLDKMGVCDRTRIDEGWRRVHDTAGLLRDCGGAWRDHRGMKGDGRTVGAEECAGLGRGRCEESAQHHQLQHCGLCCSMDD